MSDRTPRVIAHRGFAGVAPENTVAAFRAIADGTNPASMVELDIVPCADGTPVVFHDDRLDERGDSRGITDGTGVVWETPLETVRSATVLDSGETVPTLEAALAAIPAEIGVNVELKNPGRADVMIGEGLSDEELATGRDHWEPFVERVVGTIEDADNEVLVSSLAEGAIVALRDVAPALPAAPVLAQSIEDGLSFAERYECEAIHPALDMVLETTSETAQGQPGCSFDGRDLLEVAPTLGCAVNVWPVRTWHQAERLRAAGVDGVLANYPGLYRWSDS
jgi:glycerophosphoryl diester phosphodiesterase